MKRCGLLGAVPVGAGLGAGLEAEGALGGTGELTSRGDALVLYTDGVSRRRTGDGLFGTEGIVNAANAADAHSATGTARAIQEAVVSASEDPLPDDAAVIVLAANAASAAQPTRT